MTDGYQGQRPATAWWRVFPGAQLLAVLVAVDVAFVLGWLAIELGWLPEDRVDLDVNRGLPDTWGYVQLLWSWVACSVLAWRHREPVFAALAVVIGWLALDDGLGVSHAVGVWLRASGIVDARFGMTGSELGSLAVSAAVALPLLAIVATLHRRARPWPREVSRGVLGCLVALAIAGFGLDLVHSVVGVLDPLFTVLEEGGELLADSTLAVFLLSVALLDRAAPLEWGLDRTALTERVAPRGRASGPRLEEPHDD